ncbi:hypothetical protein G9A89_011921 [Geosiphon pyriformis]|nr:hypothetical protein G9A89_011921 [Geosiphon pyriformis]
MSKYQNQKQGGQTTTQHSQDTASIELYQNKLKEAIEQNHEELDRWQKYKKDYIQLKQKLDGLHNKLKYDAMLPFGKLAFIPGQLINTNRVMVSVGENWFIECSNTHAAQIAERRIELVHKNLKNLETRLEDLINRLKMTTDVLDIATPHAKACDSINPLFNEEGLPFVDIVEHEVQSLVDQSTQSSEKKGRNSQVYSDVDTKLKNLLDWEKLEREEEEEMAGRQRIRVINRESEKDSDDDEYEYEDEDEDEVGTNEDDDEYDSIYHQEKVQMTSDSDVDDENESLADKDKAAETSSLENKVIKVRFAQDTLSPPLSRSESTAENSIPKINTSITETSTQSSLSMSEFYSQLAKNQKSQSKAGKSMTGSPRKSTNPVKGMVVEKEPTEVNIDEFLEQVEEDILLKEVAVKYHAAREKFYAENQEFLENSQKETLLEDNIVPPSLPHSPSQTQQSQVPLKPKSLLDSSRQTQQVPNLSTPQPRPEQVPPISQPRPLLIPPSQPQPQAQSSIIPPPSQTQALTVDKSNQPRPKKISKFKAARMQGKLQD